MTIKFYCPSGHRIEAEARKVGQTIRCPACKQRVIVPPESVGKKSGRGGDSDLLPAAGAGTDQIGEPAGEPAPAGRRKSKPPPPPKSSSKRPRKKSHTAKQRRKPPPLPKDAPSAGQSETRGPVPDAKPPVAKSPGSSGDEPGPKPATERTGSKPPASKGKHRPRKHRKRSSRRKKPGSAESKETQPAAPAPPKADRRPAEPEPPRPPRPARQSWFRRGPRLMPPTAYKPDEGRVQTVQWLAFFLGLVVLFGVAPALGYLNLGTAPGWARAVLLLAALEAVYIAWMLATPDWASVWVVMLVFAFVSAAYGMATAIAVATPLDKPMPLGMGELRGSAAQWCGSVLLVHALATYLCGRTSAKWRRAFELEMAGRDKPVRPTRKTAER